MMESMFTDSDSNRISLFEFEEANRADTFASEDTFDIFGSDVNLGHIFLEMIKIMIA